MNDLDLLDDPALAGFVEELRAFGDGAPPPVDDSLEALFSGATPLARNGRRAAVIALVSAAVLGGSIGTAAANSLPDPAQRFVAGVVRTLTPFDLPTPASNAKQPVPLPKKPVVHHAEPSAPPTHSSPHPAAHSAAPTPRTGADDQEGTSGDDRGGSSGPSGSDDPTETSQTKSGPTTSDDGSGTSGSDGKSTDDGGSSDGSSSDSGSSDAVDD
jgi:hypothetical protein